MITDRIQAIVELIRKPHRTSCDMNMRVPFSEARKETYYNRKCTCGLTADILELYNEIEKQNERN